MTHIEQHKIVEELKNFRGKMNPAEQTKFDMLVKRDRDGEEFDSLAQQVMEQLQSKYIPKRSKQELEALWKKFQTAKPK